MFECQEYRRIIWIPKCANFGGIPLIAQAVSHGFRFWNRVSLSFNLSDDPWTAGSSNITGKFEREIVDTSSHASCGSGPNSTKRTGVPYIWRKPKDLVYNASLVGQYSDVPRVENNIVAWYRGVFLLSPVQPCCMGYRGWLFCDRCQWLGSSIEWIWIGIRIVRFLKCYWQSCPTVCLHGGGILFAFFSYMLYTEVGGTLPFSICRSSQVKQGNIFSLFAMGNCSMRITCRWLSLIANNHLRIHLNCVEKHKTLILPVDDSSPWRLRSMLLLQKGVTSEKYAWKLWDRGIMVSWMAGLMQ